MKREIHTLLQVLDVAARERDADFVDFGLGHRGTRSIVFFFTLSDVTHPVFVGESDGDCKRCFVSEKWSLQTKRTLT